MARQVSHPAVCRVWDIGDADGQHFLSMEFVDGENLASLLRRIGRLPAGQGPRHREAGLRGPRRRPREGRPPPGPQARERDARRAGQGPDHRLRPRRSRRGAHRRRRALGDAVLHVARAAARARGHGPQRRLRPRAASLRALHRAASLRREDSRRADTQAPRRASDRTVADRPRPRPRGREDDPRLPREGPEAAPALDPRRVRHARRDRILSRRRSRPERRRLPSSWPRRARRSRSRLGWRGPALSPSCSVPSLRPLSGIRCIWSTSFRWRSRRRSSRTGRGSSSRRLGHEGEADGLSCRRRPRSRVLPSRARRSRSEGRGWDALGTGRPAVLRFWYRQSPRPLVTPQGRWQRGLEHAPAGSHGDGGRDLRPPRAAPAVLRGAAAGRGRCRSTAAGRLVSALRRGAARPRRSSSPTEPTWTPPFFVDTRAAWTGAWPDRPDIAIRVEAAAYRGQPVWFRDRRALDATRADGGVSAAPPGQQVTKYLALGAGASAGRGRSGPGPAQPRAWAEATVGGPSASGRASPPWVSACGSSTPTTWPRSAGR